MHLRTLAQRFERDLVGMEEEVRELAGGDRWRLSPAFDINPSPSRQRVLETGIIQGGALEASLELGLEVCEFFDDKSEAARRHAVEMSRIIADNWKRILRKEGLSGDDVRGYEDAFEHAEAEKALSLGG